MRLLHSATLEIHEFIGNKLPRYAILSHTWGEGEVSFQEIGREGAKNKAGYDKIKRCCEVAASDGFEYIWADTCCIDKTSSAELSEAINSMYRWYQKAEVCYAILADVPSHDDPQDLGSAFRESRWFTRGWTLQELIAPSSMIFFNSDWEDIGTKLSLQHLISDITRIPTVVLAKEAQMTAFSVAQRMSWASKRATTRVEDMAYCLMGIFDANMPMLYGEGEKAFIRLQEEIIRTSEDDTIFAWWRDDRSYGLGLLADSPDAFAASGNVTRLFKRETTFSSINNQIQFRLPLQPIRSQNTRSEGSISYRSKGMRTWFGSNCFAILSCTFTGETERMLGISLEPVSGHDGLFRRAHHAIFQTIQISEVRCLERETIFVEKILPFPMSHFILSSIQLVYACCFRTSALQGQEVSIVEVYPLLGTHDGPDAWRGPNLGVRLRSATGIIVDLMLKFRDGDLLGNLESPICYDTLQESFFKARGMRNYSDRISWQNPFARGGISVSIKKVGEGWGRGRDASVAEQGAVMERMFMLKPMDSACTVTEVEDWASDRDILNADTGSVIEVSPF